MSFRVRSHGRRLGVAGAVAVVLLAGSVMVPAAVAHISSVGKTYGGVTSKGMPVVVDMTANRRQVVKAVAALVLTCTSGDTAALPDKFTKLPVNRKGKFRNAFGPVTVRNDDGTTTDYQGRITGKLNFRQTKLTGTWRFSLTDRDTAGAVTDTCDSGALTWSAKQ